MVGKFYVCLFMFLSLCCAMGVVQKRLSSRCAGVHGTFVPNGTGAVGQSSAFRRFGG